MRRVGSQRGHLAGAALAGSCAVHRSDRFRKVDLVASLLAHISATRAVHILTIEDRVEYMHTHKMGAVSQREVGSDTRSFAAALKSPSVQTRCDSGRRNA